jgi:hypothetical protein
MKEYTIKLNLLIETEESDYDRISDYAEEICEKIMNDEKFNYEDIEVVGVTVDEVEDFNEDDVDWYANEDDNF